MAYNFKGSSLEVFNKYTEINKPYELNEQELIDSGILHDRIHDPINDLLMHNVYSNLYGSNYITDRQLDFDIISQINDPETNVLNQAIIEAFSHNIPIINDVKIGKLIELREKEGEAFKVYRDAVNSVLKSIRNPNTYEIKQAFYDIIVPEINKIELTIKNSKKLIWDSLTRDIIYGAGFIAIGLYGGLLPPDIGKMVAALGGFKFFHSVLEKSSKLLHDPPEIQDNKYYFLWKVKKGK